MSRPGALLVVLAAAVAAAVGGCSPCPAGFERRGTSCQPVPGSGVPRGPLTEGAFQDRFDDAVCHALEDCVCDEFTADTGSCDPDLDCPSTDWPVGCQFDPVAADACLSGRFDCDASDSPITYDIPDVCAAVYACGATTSTTTGGSGTP